MVHNIVGISAHFHDAACCLLQDGNLVAAAEEERFTRTKHESAIPRAAFRFCLEQGGLTIADVDCVAYYEDPAKKLHRQLWMGLPELPLVNPEALFRLDSNRVEREVREVLGHEGKIIYFEHHQSHAASSYYFSGFDEAAVMTIDGVGEWATTAYGLAEGNQLRLFEEVRFPHSIGLLYGAITAYLGFSVNDAEYKVMGLAPYGRPKYVEQIRKLVRVEQKGQYRLDLRCFDFRNGNRMFSENLCEVFGHRPLAPGSEPSEFAQDVAKSTQVVVEDLLLDKVAYLHGQVPVENLCLAGGVALNCVAVGRIIREGPFKRVFVQPAANDAGGALGAAALAHVKLTDRRPNAALSHVFLGPAYSSADVAALFSSSTAGVIDFRNREGELLEATTDRLCVGKVVGWFQGRMEFGPRALGARSILADPRGSEMRYRINSVVKKREAFRPFAPVILAHHAQAHFELNRPSPFMTQTCRVISPLSLPAITHVDGSARVQTVDFSAHSRLFRLLESFERRTGCPMLLNTSFNLSGEPIVCTPVDAIACFVRSGLDCLVLEDFLLDRAAVPAEWLERFGDWQPAVEEKDRSVYTLL
jgi:carbamoyltransferase